MKLSEICQQNLAVQIWLILKADTIFNIILNGFVVFHFLKQLQWSGMSKGSLPLLSSLRKTYVKKTPNLNQGLNQVLECSYLYLLIISNRILSWWNKIRIWNLNWLKLTFLTQAHLLAKAESAISHLGTSYSSEDSDWTQEENCSQ